LTTRRTHVIGVVLPEMYGDFFSELIRGVDRTARLAGYHVLVSGSHSDRAETEAVLQTLHGRVDGLILMMPGPGLGRLDRSLPRRTPAILLNGAGATAHPTLRVDNRRGARLAVDHLLDLGHRRIALVAGPEGNSDALERRRGYRQALAARGLEPDPALELPGDFREASGFRAGALLADLEPRPDAVFAANDAMAIGCLAALRDRGVRVPEELSLVGFDDVPMARYVKPALTTVRVPIAEVGGRAMERLLQVTATGDGGPPRHHVVVPTLSIRESTAAAPGAGGRTPTRRRREP
jgi:LacI family transcriptional regulator